MNRRQNGQCARTRGHPLPYTHNTCECTPSFMKLATSFPLLPLGFTQEFSPISPIGVLRVRYAFLCISNFAQWPHVLLTKQTFQPGNNFNSIFLLLYFSKTIET